MRKITATLLAMAIMAVSVLNASAASGEKSVSSTTQETETATKEFKESITIDDMTITVSSKKGVIPEGSTLSAKKTKSNKTDENIRASREGNLVKSCSYDIKILNDGEEIQPDGKVEVSFKSDQVANKNLSTEIYHTHKKTEKLKVDEEGDTATVTTDGFSVYTVEFTYGDKQYVMDSDDQIPLWDVLETIGLSGETIENAETSDKEKIEAYKDEETQEWYLFSDMAFKTEEWLDVTIDGITYRVTVTDSLNINGSTVDDVEGIEQGNILNDFTANMPIATIWVDETKVNMTRASRDTGEGCFVEGGLLNSAKTTWPGVFLEGQPARHGNNFITLNLKEAAKNLALPRSSTSDHLYYGGDIAEFVYKDAARDSEGNLLDVYITYSNLGVNFQNNITQTNWNNMKANTAVSLWSGNMSDIGCYQLAFDNEGNVTGNTSSFYGSSNSNQRVGIYWDTTVQIKYPTDYEDAEKAGKAVDGTFYFPMVDIDVLRSGSGFGSINRAGNHNSFSEQIMLYEDSVDPSSKIYIPGADTTKEINYLTGIEKTPDGWLFNPIGSTSGIYDKSFYSGFVTLANNLQGMKIQGTLSGSGSAQVETYTMVAPNRVQYQLKTSTTTYNADGERIGGENDGGAEGEVGGRIRTTQLGNKNGNLSDTSSVINEGTIATAAAQKVKFTLTPMPGYKLKGNVKLGTGTLDYTGESGGTVQEITPTPVTDDTGNIKYYTFEFWSDRGIGEDNCLHADWEPAKLRLKKNIARNGFEKDGSFTFRMTMWNPEVETNNYLVKAKKKVDNPIVTETIFTEVEEPVPGEKYYMYDGNGYLMGWDAGEWERKSVDINAPLADYPSEEYLFTYRGADDIRTQDNLRLLQRKADYAIIAGEYSSGLHWYFVPSAENHAIEWETGCNTRDNGATPENPITYEVPNHYCVYNGGEHRVKFYKATEVSYRRYPVHTHWEKKTFNVTQESPEMEEGEEYLLHDSNGNFLSWNDETQAWDRIAEEDAETSDLSNAMFKLNEYDEFVWAKNEDYHIIADMSGGVVGKMSVGTPEGTKVSIKKTWYFRWSTNEETYLARDTYDYQFTNPKGYVVEEVIRDVAVEDDFAYLPYNFEENPMEGYEITPEENGYYNFNGSQAPDFSSWGEEWEIEVVPQNVDASYDIAAKLAAKGVTAVEGVPNTYEVTLTTENLTKELNLDGILPIGWSYTITENDLNAWELVSTSGNTSASRFDGDENVVFENRRKTKPITIEKIWDDDNNAGEYRPSELTASITTNENTYTTSDWTKSGNTWTKSFTVDWEEHIVSATETVPQNYKQKSLSIHGDTARIVNEILKHSLLVEKHTLFGEGTFNFRVKVTDKNNNPVDLSTEGGLTPVTDANQDGIADDGIYAFSITTSNHEGEHAVHHLRFDYSYEVWEVNTAGQKINAGSSIDSRWRLKEQTGATGTMSSEKTATFLNERKVYLPATGKKGIGIFLTIIILLCIARCSTQIAKNKKKTGETKKSTTHSLKRDGLV